MPSTIQDRLRLPSEQDVREDAVPGHVGQDIEDEALPQPRGHRIVDAMHALEVGGEVASLTERDTSR